MKTPQAKQKLTTRWGVKEDELPDLSICSGGWDWVKRHIDMAVDARLLDLLEDWEKDEKCIPELESKLCRDAKLDLCELESELSQIENDAHDGDMSTGRGALLLGRRNSSVTDFSQMIEIDEPEKTLPRKLLNMLGKLLNPFSNDKKSEKKLQEYIKDRTGTAKKRAEKRLKCLLENKDELPTFINELMRRPLNYVRKLETKIPNMILSNQMLLNSFDQEIKQGASSRPQYITMMSKIEVIRRRLLDYGECYLFANDYEAEDVELLAITPTTRFVRRDSLRDVIRRSSTTEEMEVLQSPHGIWTSGNYFLNLNIFNSLQLLEGADDAVIWSNVIEETGDPSRKNTDLGWATTSL